MENVNKLHQVGFPSDVFSSGDQREKGEEGRRGQGRKEGRKKGRS
jgi:hypothetical protein